MLYSLYSYKVRRYLSCKVQKNTRAYRPPSWIFLFFGEEPLFSLTSFRLVAPASSNGVVRGRDKMSQISFPFVAGEHNPLNTPLFSVAESRGGLPLYGGDEDALRFAL